LEGSAPAQPTAAPATPLPVPKGKTMMYAVVAVEAIVVVVGAAAAVVLMGPSSGGGGGTTASGTWDPQVGQYLDYSASSGTASITEHLLVKSANATSVTLNITVTGGAYPGSQDLTVNKTDAGNVASGIDNAVWGTPLTNQGKQAVSTNWGVRSCDHFHASYSRSGTTWSEDTYLYGGVLVKMDISIGGTQVTLMLTGTDISLITNG